MDCNVVDYMCQKAMESTEALSSLTELDFSREFNGVDYVEDANLRKLAMRDLQRSCEAIVRAHKSLCHVTWDFDTEPEAFEG